ncbi:O-antigen ligase family protein [Mucilaginibacter sp. HD30]
MGGLMAAILLINSFVFDRATLYPTQNGQLFFLIICGISLAVLVSLYAIIDSKRVLSCITFPDILLFILLFYFSIHTYLFYRSRAPIEAMGIFALVPLYLTVRLLKTDLLIYLLIALMIAGIGQAIYGMLQLYDLLPSYHNIFKITGGFFNPAPYSAYLITAFPIAMGYLLFREKASTNMIRFYEAIAAITVVAIICILPSTASRAAIIALVISFIYLILKRFPNNLIVQRKKYAIMFIGLFALLALTFGLYKIRTTSADGRLLIWRTSLQMVWEKPLLGYGFEQFKAEYMKQQANYITRGGASDVFSSITENVDYPFNEPLHILIEFGFIGLLICTLLVIILFFEPEEPEKEEIDSHLIYMLRAALLSLLVFSCFSYPFEIWPVLVNTVFLLAGISNLGKPLSINKLNSTVKKTIVIPFGLLVCLVVPMLWIKLNQKRDSYHSWKYASLLYNKQYYQESVTSYRKAYPALNNNGLFLAHYGKALLMSGQYANAVKILQESLFYRADPIIYTDMGNIYMQAKLFVDAEKMYLMAYRMMPSRFYAPYLLAKLYYRSKEPAKALRMAHEVLEKRIRIPSPAITEIKQEMKELTYQLNKTP